MATRSERLQRLGIGSSCHQSWDEMEGSGQRRFCSSCQRSVLDFASLTGREIEAHLEASRGRLCARLTRGTDGRLVVLPDASPVAAAAGCDGAAVAAILGRRSAPLAAAVLGAFLTVTAASAQPRGGAGVETAGAATSSGDGTPKPAGGIRREAREAREARAVRSDRAGARLRGWMSDPELGPLPGAEVVARNTLDGREGSTTTDAAGAFAFESLDPGVYDVRGHVEGYAIPSVSGLVLAAGSDTTVEVTATAATESMTLGVIAYEPEPLRRAFESSEIVVLATVRDSIPGAPDDVWTEVDTELRIDAVLKGDVAGRSVVYRHIEYADPEPEDADSANGSFDIASIEGPALGTQVLAFLQSEESDTPDAAPIYRSTHDSAGIKELTDDEMAAYSERLEALSTLLEGGSPPAAELAEWLVATVEEPLTRGEALPELSMALEALRQLAQRDGVSIDTTATSLLIVEEQFRDAGGEVDHDPLPALVAAHVTPGQHERLRRALRETEGLRAVDLDLAELVRAFDPDPDRGLDTTRSWLVRQALEWTPGPEFDSWLWQRVGEVVGDDALSALISVVDEEVIAVDEALDEDADDAEIALRASRIAAIQEVFQVRLREVLAAKDRASERELARTRAVLGRS